ncbi:hypothetical protein FRB97_009552 [Tulasnella sp. 331]|nr:hypothetical protein FRB97_009552 [Tulasnella sp. 331]
MAYIDTIGSALDSLRRYGIPIPTDPAAEIWSTLLRQAHLDPIQAYTIAASHDASSVCVLASEHTLSRSLDSVSEADALRMGPIYLRLLFRLHIGRNQALGRVIKTPPKEHLPSKTCSISAQRFVMSAWSLTVASVMSGARVHNTSAIELREAFGPLMQKNTCELCKDNAPARISEMIRAWLAIRRTI